MRALIALAIASSIALPAFAAPRRLAIVTLTIDPESRLPTGAALFDAIHRGIELRIGVDAADYQELYIDNAEAIASKATACGSDLPCLAALLSRAGFPLALRAVANGAIDPPLLDLAVIDTQASKVIADSVSELSGGDPIATARARAEELLDRAGIRRGGRIVVAVKPADAEVTLSDGTGHDPGRAGSFTVAPGPHTVRAARAGFAAREEAITVESGKESKVELELIELPRDESLLASAWFWTGVGVAVAGGITALALALAPNTTPDCLCIGPSTADCGRCFAQ